MDHGGLGHGHTLHEELVHIPLFFILPQSNRNSVFRIETEVSLTDVLPTSCDLLDVACPLGEGRSLAPLLAGKQKTLWTASFSALENVDHRAVRWGRYKGIFKKSDFFLFDLEVDRDEMREASAEHSIAESALRISLGNHLFGLGRGMESTGTTGRSTTHQTEILTEFEEDTRVKLEELGYLRASE